MKTITCCICGKEITKRKSLAFSDGRACRDHAEVIEFSVQLKLAKSENLRKLLTLTDYQVENWRPILYRLLGPYALIMTRDEVQAIKDLMQRQVNNLGLDENHE